MPDRVHRVEEEIGMVQPFVALHGWGYTLVVAVGLLTLWQVLSTGRREFLMGGSSS